MKVLWITNILFPNAAYKLTGNRDFKSSGGWLIGAASALSKYKSLELSIASVSNLVSHLEVINTGEITYYVIPSGKGVENYNSSFENYWKEIKSTVNPDVIHIYGTEYPIGLSYLRACGNKHVVVSVQGLKYAIAKYYLAGLTPKDVYCNITLHDILKGSLIKEQKDFKKKGLLEKETLRSVKHIIGRTSWDHANTWAINPMAEYHFCNETLRDEFYDGSEWNYDSCKKHSIFLSQGSYPLKGLHKVVQALPAILHYYPDACIRVAGNDITKYKGFSGYLHYGGYGSYIKNLIDSLGLLDKVTFTGPLNAEEMKHEYLNANVFVCPSSVENSPNSLGEAQILGVPCIASFAGGIPDMMQGDESHLYRFEETEMLAKMVCDVFNSGSVHVDMKPISAARHNTKTNASALVTIYKQISKE